MMDINQLTANINSTQAQLARQISQLQQQLAASGGESAEKLAQDLQELARLQQKLAKSRAVALRAHALQTDQKPNSQGQKRLLGLALCAFSAVGLLVLITLAFIL